MKVLDVHTIPSRGIIAVVALDTDRVPNRGDDLRVDKGDGCCRFTPILGVEVFAKLGGPKKGDSVGILISATAGIRSGDDVSVFTEEDATAARRKNRMTAAAYQAEVAFDQRLITCSNSVCIVLGWNRHIQETTFEITIRRAEYQYGLEQVPASSYRGKVRL